MKFRDTSLSVPDRVEALIDELTISEKVSQLVMENAAVERLGIGSYHWWNEALHGYARAGIATVFPQAIGLAASWSPELLHTVADIAATEGRAKNNEELASRDGNTRCYYGNTIWSPNINIFRDPRWGRGQETYGEDPMLTGSLGVAFVRGLQGDDPKYLKSVGTLKHFAVHSGPEPIRHEFDAKVSEKDLRDTYLPAFEEGIREGDAKSVMSAYNGFNGSPCVVSHRLLTEILRDEWGFDGAVVGDVDNINDLYFEGRHGWAKTGAEAMAGAIKAGNDLRSGKNEEHALEALEKGLLSEDDIDKALRCLLSLRFKLGHFDPREDVPWSKLTSEAIETPEHKQASYDACRQSLVLLKNDGVLPMKTEEIKKVAVIGPTADDMEVLLGNYSGTPYDPVTILQGLKQKLEPQGIEVLDEVNIPFAVGHSSKGNPVPPGTFFVDSEGKQRGLTCRMYNGPEPKGEPVVEQVDVSPALEWNTALPRPPQLTEDQACVVWSGYINIEYEGSYTFYTTIRGKASIEIEGHDEVKAYSKMAIQTRSRSVVVSRKGLLPITITCQQLSDECFYALEWDPADGGIALEKAYERALSAAEASDIIFLTLGLCHKLEGEEMAGSVEGFHRGDRTTINLPEPQKRLMDLVSGLRQPVVLLLSTGSAVSFDPGKVNAVVQTWYYGAEGGRAVADALFGEFSPAGRLPVTFYASDNDLPDFEDYAMKGRTYRYFEGKPLFAFGHGLTYTTFDYSNLTVERCDGELVAELKVVNSGSVTSDEVVQLYASREERNQEDPIRWLVGYKRVRDLHPGETRSVEIVIPDRWLALWSDEAARRILNPGRVLIHAGPASDNLPICAEIVV